MQRAQARRALPLSIALAIAAALLCLVASPGAAFAADVASVLLVACAEDEAGALPPEPMCEVRTVEDDEGFFAAAPICDPSGASAVAPPPVAPIGDDKIEQTPGCHDDGGALQLGPRPAGDDSSHHPLALSFDPAVLPDGVRPPTWSGHVTLTTLGALLGPSEGVERRVEHPPHAA